MADKTGKRVIITAGEQILHFSVTLDDFHRYQNEMSMDNKVAPSKNFLARTVAPDDQAAMEQLISEGYALDLAAMVAGEFRPALELSVKK